MSAFYITTAIEYANGDPHVGHAFEKIGADAIARYHRLRGDDVRLLVGTDDHGLKVARAAQVAGVTPREQADRISAIFRCTWDTLGIRYDRFVRTTVAHHADGVRTLDRTHSRTSAISVLRACIRRLVLRRVRGVSDGTRAGERSLPIASHDRHRARGGVQLVLSIERASGVPCRVPARNPAFIQPAGRYNEILAFVERGLEDVSVTRASLDWGIPFPLPARDGRHQAIYVWFDALPSYLTATGYPRVAAISRGPRKFTSSGKTSRDFTVYSGQRCFMPPVCRCRSACGRTGS